VLGAQLLALALPTSIGAAVLPDLKDHQWRDCAIGAPAAQSTGRRRTLILHDRGNVGSDAGAAYATLMANLSSHFGPVKVAEAGSYRPGEMLPYDLLIYVGSGYGETLPESLLKDVNSGKRPVLWLKQNIDQLASEGTFYRAYGWLWKDFDGPSKFKIKYKRAVLEPSDSGAGLTTFSKLDKNRVRILATADVGDKSVPWAVRSKRLTYIADLPLGSEVTQDASLALTDLLHDLGPGADPATFNRHRALVRIEDIGPMSDPKALRNIAEAMKREGIPYSIAVYPVYVGPMVRGRQKTVRLADRPEVVRTIVEMLDGGATLVLHGYSHQFGNRRNPRTGESGADYLLTSITPEMLFTTVRCLVTPRAGQQSALIRRLENCAKSASLTLTYLTSPTMQPPLPTTPQLARASAPDMTAVCILRPAGIARHRYLPICPNRQRHISFGTAMAASLFLRTSGTYQIPPGLRALIPNPMCWPEPPPCYLSVIPSPASFTTRSSEPAISLTLSAKCGGWATTSFLLASSDV
jgi:hypothetical protein